MQTDFTIGIIGLQDLFIIKKGQGLIYKERCIDDIQNSLIQDNQTFFSQTCKNNLGRAIETMTPLRRGGG